jgi:hypothetical protein
MRAGKFVAPEIKPILAIHCFSAAHVIEITSVPSRPVAERVGVLKLEDAYGEPVLMVRIACGESLLV